ncbi:hypothetical protein K503DRAFT_700691 [Rhizopogon vinicolor AM-OR11-026]|uniref:GAG-pre-integrase domain-containing protein n=1 Tax=Rhizopogon vinicolor AM-OR11-026 TaxID=1314800 RepID=A0A1B7ML17_9AGAM|nr:hypothetical protein K503DRAFT_700691 [Rhizopogon vinicolor AM-OR11-026]
MLITTNRIAAAGLAVYFEGNKCKILSPSPQCTVIAEIPQVDGLYAIAGQHKHHATIAKGRLTVSELHCALGHISQSAVKLAVENGLIEGVELDSASEPEFCDACIKGKATWQPFPKESKWHCGILNTTSCSTT